MVTVTVTASPADPPPPVPQKTVTTTVTVPPATHPPKTKPKPKPPKAPVQQPVVPQPTVPQLPVQPPTNPPIVLPSQTPAAEVSEPEPVFPSTEQVPADPSSPPVTPSEPFEDTAPASVPYEIRNANSDVNAPELSRQLGIPALILVLVVLFAVLIFEGRLRRLAHASAVRRAGPRPAEPMGYPAGPAYAPAPGLPPAVYQGGTAYAPIISFVPMQMYGPASAEGYAPEHYPEFYDQPLAMPEPDPDPPGGADHPRGRAQPDYERTVQEQAPRPPGIPHSPGGDRGEDTFPGQPGRPGSLFQPATPPSGGPRPRGAGEFPAPFSRESSATGGDGQAPGAGNSPDDTGTAVYPLPGRGEEDGRGRGGLFRRSS
ncbi:hypothetical protein GCM10017673_34960 [Streptosporangium violaceochromogenes]|nr:hypothetical protein GCM10017673_34960 [Streptosporangium violaceochromogenes]